MAFCGYAGDVIFRAGLVAGGNKTDDVVVPSDVSSSSQLLLPAFDVVAGGQATHVLTDDDADSVEYLPAAQSIHVLLEVAAPSDEYFPMLQ